MNEPPPKMRTFYKGQKTKSYVYFFSFLCIFPVFSFLFFSLLFYFFVRGGLFGQNEFTEEQVYLHGLM